MARPLVGRAVPGEPVWKGAGGLENRQERLASPHHAPRAGICKRGFGPPRAQTGDAPRRLTKGNHRWNPANAGRKEGDRTLPPLRMDLSQACPDGHPQYSPRRPFHPLRMCTPATVFQRAAPPSRRGGDACARSLLRIPPIQPGQFMKHPEAPTFSKRMVARKRDRGALHGEGRAPSRPRGRGVPGMSQQRPVETARTKPGPPGIRRLFWGSGWIKRWRDPGGAAFSRAACPSHGAAESRTSQKEDAPFRKPLWPQCQLAPAARGRSYTSEKSVLSPLFGSSTGMRRRSLTSLARRSRGSCSPWTKMSFFGRAS